MELLTTIYDHDKKMARNPDEKDGGISYFLVNPLGDQKIETPRTRPAERDMNLDITGAISQEVTS